MPPDLRDPNEPIGQLSPQDWLSAPPARMVLAALSAGGADVRFVGGCVRDAVLRRPVHDIDIGTPEEPGPVMRRLAEAGIKTIPTGLEHGTVTAIVEGQSFEITSLREDIKTDGRHAEVAFTTDWVKDAARRDLTINTLSADGEGRIFDPFGALADLAAGRVRFVGDPARRIGEDVLRLLRFFRFHAHYGRPPVDRAGLSACRRLAPRLSDLSGERVRGEILRLLEAPDPSVVLVIMRADGILAPILPEAHAMGRLRVLVWLESRALARATITPDPLRRLAAMLDGGRAAAEQVALRLRLSAAEAERLAVLMEPPLRLGIEPGDSDIRQALYRLGAGRVRDLILLRWADERFHLARPSPARTARWTALLDAVDSWLPVILPVRGQDCLDLGVPPGPRVGEILAEVESWWRGQDFAPDRAGCLARLALAAMAAKDVKL